LLTQEELRSGLRQFSQIDGWYHHWLHQFVFSDGVKWLCDHCECRWLLTDIAFFQLRIKTDHPQLEPFQIWHLKCLPGNRAILECYGGTSQQPIIRDELVVVEFALANLTLWLVNGMLILPSEYSGMVQSVSQGVAVG